MSADRLGTLAHELRSPVAALAAIARAFPEAPAVQRARLLELAGAAGRGIARLLDDAAIASLSVTRLDAGDVAAAAVETAALAGVHVRLERRPDLFVLGDPERLRQALDNLIGNAAGHSPPGAGVDVSAYATDGAVVIAVADRGDGIDAVDIARIFEQGTRATEARPGSGLGLWIVRAIAEAHGGSVEVDSNPGAGATFRLVLPRAASATA